MQLELIKPPPGSEHNDESDEVDNTDDVVGMYIRFVCEKLMFFSSQNKFLVLENVLHCMILNRNTKLNWN